MPPGFPVRDFNLGTSGRISGGREQRKDGRVRKDKSRNSS
jgi:hypothetical protein